MKQYKHPTLQPVISYRKNYSAAAEAVVVAAGASVFFFGVAFFLGAAVDFFFDPVFGAVVPLDTRPDFVLVNTVGFSVTAGALRVSAKFYGRTVESKLTTTLRDFLELADVVVVLGLAAVEAFGFAAGLAVVVDFFAAEDFFGADFYKINKV